jgi:hypothetical protein
MFGEKAVFGFAVTLLVLLQILGLELSFWVVGAYGCLMGGLFVLEGGHCYRGCKDMACCGVCGVWLWEEIGVACSFYWGYMHVVILKSVDRAIVPGEKQRQSQGARRLKAPS